LSRVCSRLRRVYSPFTGVRGGSIAIAAWPFKALRFRETLHGARARDRDRTGDVPMIGRHIFALATLLASFGAATSGNAQDVTTAYGRRDQWQAVDQVNSGQLGGARNGARSRTPASAPCVMPCSSVAPKRSTERK
jgi:hypothetical protein